MKTKYDIGDEVLVKAKVKRIKIDESGLIKYSLYSENWTNIEVFDEEEIVGSIKNKVEQEYMSELCKGCSKVCSSCMVWKELNGIGVD